MKNLVRRRGRDRARARALPVALQTRTHYRNAIHHMAQSSDRGGDSLGRLSVDKSLLPLPRFRGAQGSADATPRSGAARTLVFVSFRRAAGLPPPPPPFLPRIREAHFRKVTQLGINGRTCQVTGDR